jgi:hypothetical protein
LVVRRVSKISLNNDGDHALILQMYLILSIEINR